jgi:catechol 2,3-dioxygenase-like lactoylglutathione lyase family enzyme
MVSGVDHVAIAAKDSRALTNWYCEVLGMRVLFDNGKEPPTTLVGGDMGGVLEIMPDNGADLVKHQPLDPGIRHIAFRVQDFDAVYASLEGKVLGLMPPGPAAGGGQIAFFHDLEGNLVQLVSRDKELF